MIVFSLTYGRTCFLLVIFEKRGACVLIPVDALAAGGWSVSFSLSFSLAFDWKLVSLFLLLGWPFFGTVGDRIGSLRSCDLDPGGDLQDAVFWVCNDEGSAHVYCSVISTMTRR